LRLAYPLWRFWPADTGLFASFASAVRPTSPQQAFVSGNLSSEAGMVGLLHRGRQLNLR
jgi:hypothetical protein